MVAQKTHNPEVGGSIPSPATRLGLVRTPEEIVRHLIKPYWPMFRGCSSVGRALPSQGKSQGFDSPQLHPLSGERSSILCCGFTTVGRTR